MHEAVFIVHTSHTKNEPDLHQALVQSLRYQSVAFKSVEEAVEWLRHGRIPSPDTLLVDVQAESTDHALPTVQALRKLRADLPVLVLLGYDGERLGADLVQAGAYDFILKPFSVDRLRLAIQNALRYRRMSQYVTWLERKVAGHMAFEDIVGGSDCIRKIVAQAGQAAATRQPVWIDGGPGTGKTLLARAIHGTSDRAGKPCVAVNCALLPTHLASGLLFGQEQQTAQDGHVHFILGKMREADQGTLLLQEATALAPELWQQLVDTLESKRLHPVGGSTPIPIDVRLICTANTTDNQAAHGLRHALAARLPISDITVPPLADRPEDIRLLAQHFLLVYASSENKYITRITERALAWLEAAQWPGNIGELANVIWRAVMLTEGDALDTDVLRAIQKHRTIYLYSQMLDIALADEKGRVKTLRSVQQEAIRYALQQEGGCMTRAARSLGIGRSTLYRKVSQYSLEGYIARANQTTRPTMNISPMERS